MCATIYSENLIGQTCKTEYKQKTSTTEVYVMTSRIIYHDFRKASAVTKTRALNRHNRMLQKVNEVLNSACMFFCGACTAASVFVLLMLCGGR